MIKPLIRFIKQLIRPIRPIRQIINVYGNHFHKSVQSDEIVKSSKTIQTEQLEVAENTIKTPSGNLETNQSLEEVIRYNNWFLCEICKFKSKSKKGLRNV